MRKLAEKKDSIKEARERRLTKRLILGTAAVIVAGGIAGAAALHEADVYRSREKAVQKAQEEEKEEKKQETRLTPEEKKQQEIEQVKQEAKQAGCPDALISLIDQNDETLEFVKDYAQKKDSPVPDTVELPPEGTIPHYLQWDERWGYASYGTSTIAGSGCGPTCMSMVIVGLTRDPSATPYRLARYSEENGFVDEANNTYWAFLDSAARQWGLQCREGMMDETELAAELAAGHPVICSMLPGDFTDGGHFLVLTGDQNGQISLLDPFSRRNTEKLWNYTDIADQIREMWVFEKA